MKRILPLALLVTFLVHPSFAADAAPDKPLLDRAADVQKLFRKDPGGYAKLFDESFRKAVPDKQLTSIFTSYFKKYGACTSIQFKQNADGGAAVFDFNFAKGQTAPVTLSVDPKDPHLITGLIIGPAVKRAGSFDDILAKVKTLPGAASFLAQQLDAQPKPKTLASYNDDKSKHRAVAITSMGVSLASYLMMYLWK